MTRDDITVSNDDYKDAVAKQRGVGECSKHPGEDAWGPTITAARLFEKAEKALLRDADAYFAQRAAQEALSLLKANERQIEQLHTLLGQEGSDDGR